MKIGEVISRLDENQIYNILGISSSLVGCDGSSLLIHGVADLYEHWDKISCAVASFVFPCKFEHIVITGCPIPESLDEWYSVLYGITTKIDTNGVDHVNFIGKRIDFDNVETRGFNHSECSDMPTHLKLINNFYKELIKDLDEDNTHKSVIAMSNILDVFLKLDSKKIKSFVSAAKIMDPKQA